MTVRSPLAAALLLLAGCTGASQERRPPSASDRVPAGATVGASGYATLLTAPASPAGPEARPRAAAASMADERRLNPDADASRAAELLDRRLAAAEPGTYIGVRIVRDPTPRFAFQFRRDAAATLARHSRDPRFTSREGGVPKAELQPIFDTWHPRFSAHRLVGGASVQEFEGVVAFDLIVDEATFRTVAAAQRWTIPDRLRLRFAPPPNPRSIDPALAPLVRVFARSDRATGITLAAARRGRVVLRDGCFRVAGNGTADEPLVLFDRDAELGLDAERYLVLRDGPGEPTRIGEPVVWAGPRGADEADAGVRALRAHCGEGPIVPIGSPTSATRFPPRQ